MAVHLEFRDAFFAAQSGRIAGCDIDDLGTLIRDPGDRGVSGSCDRGALDGAARFAMYDLAFPPEGLAHNLGLYSGISVLF